MTPCSKCAGVGMIFPSGKPMTCALCKGKGVVEVKAPARRPIVIVGDYWGHEEVRLGQSFVGANGKELDRLLEEAEIDKRDCYLTSVFNLMPQPKQDILNLTTKQAFSQVPMPPLTKGAYLENKYFPEVQRLWRELEEWKPNLVIAMGNAALWALTGAYGIKYLRGTVTESVYGPRGLKILPTYNPGNVFRDWSIRSVVIADLMKAKLQSTFPEIRRPSRKLWLEPQISDIQKFYEFHVKPSKVLSVDIETAGQTQITCVGFAPSADLALVIPFVDWRKPDGSYWPTAHQEKLAWQWVSRFLAHTDNPSIQILGQNYLYDTNWLWQKVGLTSGNFCRDTMLKHHAMNPELEKGLGFLGSIYTDEPAWKLMRSKTTSTKRGE